MAEFFTGKIISKRLNIFSVNKFSKIILIYILFVVQSSYAASNEITELFIEATGNNIYEAKIKAHEFGMKRAILLIADKIGISGADINIKIPYQKLKEVFTPTDIINEFSMVEKYSATVTYVYDQTKLYELLLASGGAAVDDLFYEYIIIPVFKQSSFLNIWNKDKKWNDFWIESRQLLDQYKIFYPEKTLYLTNQISEKNLFSLDYEKLVKIFQTYLFKNIIFVTGEYFTDRKTSESLIRVTKYIFSPDLPDKKIITQEYPLVTQQDISTTVNLVIKNIVQQYGKVRTTKSPQHLSNKPINLPPLKPIPIVMSLEAYDQAEVDLVKSKLAKVKEIDKFIIENDYSGRYKIIIYTDSSKFELAEGLYTNGLSYKIHGNLYNLIDIKKGS